MRQDDKYVANRFLKRLYCSVKMSPRRIVEKVETMSRPLIWVVQTGIFAVSGITAFLLRFDLSLPPREMAHLVYALSVWVVVKIIVFRIAQLDRGWWRFMSLDDLPRLAMGNLLGSLPREPLRFCGSLRVVSLGPSTFSICWSARC